MNDSILEGSSDYRRRRRQQFMFGRIVKVDTMARLVDVVTFGSAAHGTDDQRLQSIQFLSQAFHPGGDENFAMPRVGTYVVVALIEGEGFVLGSFRPLPAHGKNIGDSDPLPLREGDFVWKTQAGSRRALYASGLIEDYSSETLKRTYFPGPEELSDFCFSYKRYTDAGLLFAYSNDDDTTITQYEYRADITKLTGVVVDQIGAVDTDGTVFQRQLGTGAGAPPFTVPLPTYAETINITGEQVCEYGPEGVLTVTKSPDGTYKLENPGVTTTVAPDGSYKLEQEIGTTLTVDAEGTFRFENEPASMEVNIDGTYTFENEVATLSVDPKGALSFENDPSSLGIDEKGALSFAGPVADLSLTETGDLSFDNETVQIDATAAGEYSVKATEAQLAMGKGQVAFGTPQAELLTILGNVVTALITLATAMQLEAHEGNLGYPTLPPMNAATYAQVQGQLQQSQALLTEITKGL